MSWNQGWNKVFQEHEWGRWPSEELVRFVGRHFRDCHRNSRLRALEVGCGTGANLVFLAKEGFQTVGMDGSDVALKRARGRLQEEGLLANLHLGDVVKLPFPDAEFDLVADVECIYANSWEDSRRIIREVHRVLKPGGMFLSITFSTKTFGYGQGESLPQEPNTFAKLERGALKKGYGIIRFTAREDIGELYSPFQVESVDYQERSQSDGEYIIHEWLIRCRKPER